MKKDFLLESKTARALYAGVADLPVCDYHCHLPPREILEDRAFDDITALWLGGDHYKWRLMRQAGVDERLITGGADPAEKFRAYIGALESAAGSPLYDWSRMELDMFFGVTDEIRAANADAIREKCNRAIVSSGLSPRKCIRMRRVALVATTDDPADDLEAHRLLREDADKGFEVLPSFRTDRMLSIRSHDYPEYAKRLGLAAGLKIDSLETLRTAVSRRLDAFAALGCRISDVGLPAFPDSIAPDEDADAALRAALAGRSLDRAAYLGFLGNMYVFLGREYAARGMLMQWHLGVMRNVNSAVFRALGADAGCDCAGDPAPLRDVARMLDAIESAGGLPETVIYALSGAANAPLATLAGAFRRVRIGAAWWFLDHERGIADVLETVSANGHLGSFLGMLTDSRSFLSYARHDYFRRILASFTARLVDAGRFPEASARDVMRRICFDNINALLH